MPEQFAVLSGFRLVGIALLIAPLLLRVLYSGGNARAVRNWILGHYALGIGLILVSFRDLIPFWITFHLAQIGIALGFTWVIRATAFEGDPRHVRRIEGMVWGLAGLYLVGAYFHVGLGTGISARVLHTLAGQTLFALFLTVVVIALHLQRRSNGSVLLMLGAGTMILSTFVRLFFTLNGPPISSPWAPWGAQSFGFMGGLVAVLAANIGFAALQVERILGGLGRNGNVSNGELGERGDLAVVSIDTLGGIAQERQRMLAQLERASRLTETGMFSASLAHELGQPLQSIAAKAHLVAAEVRKRIQGGGRPEDENLLGLAEDVVHQSKRASEIIRGLRALYAENPSDRSEVDTVALLKEAESLASDLPGGTRPTVELVPNESVDTTLHVIADRIQLQLVFYNVFANATDALAEVPNPTVQVRVTRDRDQVVVVFHDNGPGLPDELLGDTRVFRPSRKSSGGMGVGLLLCRTIVERHGGALIAENAPEGGALITVRLPAIGTSLDPFAHLMATP